MSFGDPSESQATVAHLAEQHIRNVQVAGSIPASGSMGHWRSWERA